MGKQSSINPSNSVRATLNNRQTKLRQWQLRRSSFDDGETAAG
jgi:hypothetical protein